jgi:tetratricopeptide (TPR) repeat protein
MVLSAPPPDDPQDPEDAGWLERIAHLLQLARRGVLILVDRADGARLRELFLALLPAHPDLELYTDPRSLLDLPEGTTLVLAPSAEHADWLNISRPLFAERSLRVILWCDVETSKALARRATDFFDWISHRVECPPGVPAFAVEGLRCALLARAPGVIWRGEHLEQAFHLAFPKRHIRWLSAKASFVGLTVSVVTRRSEWLHFIDIDGEVRLRLIEYLLRARRSRGRAILDHPSGQLPGWHLVHDRLTSVAEARHRLERLGARRPGRLIALVGLEPEAVDLAEVLLEGGVMTRTIEESARGCADPGVALSCIAAERRLVDPGHESAAIDTNPPLLRAFARDQIIRQQRRMSLVQAIEPWARLEITDAVRRGMSFVDLFWSAFIAEQELSAETPTNIEPKLREALELLDQGGSQKDPWYAAGLEALAFILVKQGQYEDAESLLRRALTIAESSFAETLHHSRVLSRLASVLLAQGRPEEAESFAELAMQIVAKAGDEAAPGIVDALYHLAAVQRALGKEAAISTARRALDMLPAAFAPDDPELRKVALRLEEILAGIGVHVQTRPIIA